MENTTGAEWMGQSPSLSTQRSSLTGTGKEQARGIMSAARERLIEQLDSRKDLLVDRIDSFVDSLDRAGQSLKGDGGVAEKLPVDRAGSLLREVSGRLRDRSTTELLDDVEDGIRARPGLAFAGLAAIGFLALRWVRG
jgi:hypothetical protein